MNFAKIGGSLLPETAYQFRSIYDNNAAEVSDNVVVTTEAAAQVGNAGFEDWTTETMTVNVNLTTKKFTHNWYNAFSTSDLEQWWAVTSKQSMPSSVSTSSNYNVKNIPTVAYSADSFSGSKSAHIFTVNIGYFNTPDVASGTSYAGELFIGTADDSGNPTYSGHRFTTRPDKISFRYKYAPKGSEKFYVNNLSRYNT